MIDELRNQIITTLSQHRVCIITTSGSLGAWALVAQYENQGLELTCQLPRWSDVIYHLEQDPHTVVIIVDTQAVPLCWLEYRGIARVMDASDDRYITVCITPKRLDLFDENRGWGNRETLDL